MDAILKEYDHLKLRGTNGTIHGVRDTEVLLQVHSGVDTTVTSPAAAKPNSLKPRNSHATALGKKA